VSQWKTKLTEFVELHDKWEVGLLEVSSPCKVYNVYGNRFYLIVGGLTPNWTIVLDDGTYYTVHSIIGEIQRSTVSAAIANDFLDDKFIVQIQYANRYKHVKILFTKYAFRDNWVYFSDDLASMLGFKPNKYHWFNDANDDKEIYAERPVLLSAGIGNVYVYCDLLKHVMFGDIKVPLRIVNRQTDVSRVDDIVEHTTFNPIQYMPL